MAIPSATERKPAIHGALRLRSLRLAEWDRLIRDALAINETTPALRREHRDPPDPGVGSSN